MEDALKGGSPRAFLIQFKQHQSANKNEAQEREFWQEGKISMKIITCEQVSCGHPNIEHQNGAEDDVHQTKEEVIDVG